MNKRARLTPSETWTARERVRLREEVRALRATLERRDKQLEEAQLTAQARKGTIDAFDERTAQARAVYGSTDQRQEARTKEIHARVSSHDRGIGLARTVRLCVRAAYEAGMSMDQLFGAITQAAAMMEDPGYTDADGTDHGVIT